MTELEIRERINAEFEEELSKCPQQINAVTNFNGKKEFWQICETDKNKRIIQIESHDEVTLYKEVYYEQNGELIYALESQRYIPINHSTLQVWACEFYAKKGKLLTFISLGHGKTETDDWEPESIFEMHKKRIAELNKIIKE